MFLVVIIILKDWLVYRDFYFAGLGGANLHRAYLLVIVKYKLLNMLSLCFWDMQKFNKMEVCPTQTCGDVFWKIGDCLVSEVFPGWDYFALLSDPFGGCFKVEKAPL